MTTSRPTRPCRLRRRPPTRFALVVLAVAACSVVGLAADADDADRQRTARVPTFDAVTLDGERVTSDDLEGKVVLLDFWGTWCAPCVSAIPTLRRIAKRHDDDPFVLLSISTDADEDALRGFVEEHDMTWPQVWDEQFRLSRQVFAVTSFPTYLVVGPEGEILHYARGGSTSIERELERKVSKAVRSLKKSRK